MPRPQVYGKRSRAVYNNFAIFDSPQRPTTLRPSGAEEKETRRLVEKVTGLSLDEYAKGVADGRRRSVLGERNANSVVSQVVPAKKVRERKPKKIAKPVDVGLGHDDHISDIEPDLVIATPREEILNENRLEGFPDVERLDADLEASADTREEGSLKEQETLPTLGEQLALQDEACAEIARCNGEPVDAANAVLDPSETFTPTPAVSNVYSQHCAQLVGLSSHRLTQFDVWAEQLANHFSLIKIAEASFGEVYRLSLLEQLPGLSASDESVFKVIALQPPAATLPAAKKQRAAALKKAEAMSKPDDVANEVKLLQRMSSIPGFTNFRDVRVLQGRPPSSFVDAFKAYNVEQKAKRKEASHFPDPAKKASYSDNQLWAVIEMQDAGIDLERFVEMGDCTSVWSVWDVFWQVVLSLAKGEEGAQFEHRDLHLGNVCVRQRSPSSPQSDPQPAIDVKKNLGFTALETTIIDYTISRCQLSASDTQRTAYHDLALDPTLFEGDSTEEYQYDIYRYMRSAVYLGDPLAPIPTSTARKHIWKSYHPVTNLVWLHYLLYKLLEQLDWPSARKAPPKKQKGGTAHAEWKRANDLEHKLLKVQKLLDPETVLCRNGLRSASDVVGLALTEGWLDVVDVVEAGAGVDVMEMAVEGGGPARRQAGEAASSDGLAEQLTHLVLDVDVMEEHGLEVAKQEARSRSRRTGTRRKV